MFIGHFGIAFGAKAVAPKVSLGSLFIAAQFVDLLWPTLLLLGIETVRIAPGATAVTPLLFDHYPVSHSLLAVAGWAILVGSVSLLLRRDYRRPALQPSRGWASCNGCWSCGVTGSTAIGSGTGPSPGVTHFRNGQ